MMGAAGNPSPRACGATTPSAAGSGGAGASPTWARTADTDRTNNRKVCMTFSPRAGKAGWIRREALASDVVAKSLRHATPAPLLVLFRTLEPPDQVFAAQAATAPQSAPLRPPAKFAALADSFPIRRRIHLPNRRQTWENRRRGGNRRIRRWDVCCG